MLRHAHASPKLPHLARLLQRPMYAAKGVLTSIWHFAATQAPRGDIGKWSDEEIAAAIGWDGEAEDLVEALVTARWVDRSQRHRLLVHDWPVHCEQIVKRTPIVKKFGFASDDDSYSLEPDTTEVRQRLCNSQSDASDSHDSLTPEPEPEPEPEPKPRRVTRAGTVECPERLDEAAFGRVTAWTQKNYPALVPILGKRWEAVVAWAQSKSIRRTLRGWEATLRTFVISAAGENPHGPSGSGPSSGRRLTAVEAGQRIRARAGLERTAPAVHEAVHVVPTLGDPGH